MGYYIQTPDNLSKVQQLLAMHDVEMIEPPPTEFNPPFDQTYVCVVSNGAFDAAGIAFDEDEFKVFAEPTDTRRKTWLLMPTDLVKELCPGAADVLL